MFRALVWKEWRQLALVRWGGIVLGALLPIALMIGADLARRGALLADTLKSHAPRDVMFELVPAALALAIWPLIGLMSAAQAFAGDRAAGTETFLIERPVPAGRLWRARLLAALANIAVVVALTGGIAGAAAALSGAPTGPGWSRFTMLTALGAALALLALLGSLIASSLISSPMAAVLLGAVLGALPVALAAQLSIFMYARMGRVPLGAVLSVLVLPAYVAGSWFALCRGEPAGRGRLRRLLTVVATAIAGVVVLFVGLAPIVVRANAMSGMHAVIASPSGGSVFLATESGSWAGGWIVDVASAKRLAFVPPPVTDLVFAPGGSEVAFLTWSGPLGSVRSEQRLDIRSTGDGRVLRSIPVGESKSVHALRWADAGIVAVVSRASSRGAEGFEVEIIDPVTGAWRPTGFRWQGWVDLVGPRQDRRVFVRVMVGANPDEGRLSPRGHRLYQVDVAAARVAPAYLDAEGREQVFAGWLSGISPSGRFARVITSDVLPRIVELGSGVDQPSATIPPWAIWTDGDRLVWHDDLDHDTRLFVETPGAPPKALRAWRDAQVGIGLSPDGRAVFVSVLPAGEAPATDAERRRPDKALFDGAVPVGAAPEEWVYLPGEDRLASVGPPFSDRPHDHRNTQWAGPKTLARIAPGVVFFEDIDAPGKRRFVIGGANDLE